MYDIFVYYYKTRGLVTMSYSFSYIVINISDKKHVMYIANKNNKMLLNY